MELIFITRNPQHATHNPILVTLNSQRDTRHPKPATRNSQPAMGGRAGALFEDVNVPLGAVLLQLVRPHRDRDLALLIGTCGQVAADQDLL